MVDRDWDNLIILDTCRCDALTSCSGVDENIDTHEGRATTTPEFLKAEFDGKDLTDTVYISANAQIEFYYEDLDTNFHDIVPLYREKNKERGEVLPGHVAKRTLNIKDEYPNKRLIVHFLQPHFPPIVDGYEHIKQAWFSDKRLNVWGQRSVGSTDIETEDLWDAYLANLRAVLPHAKGLARELDGKSVLTADHGQLFGERVRPIPIREWGHPTGAYAEELVSVPWVEFDSQDRKKIKKGQPIEDIPESKDIKKRLADLGYMNPRKKVK